MNLDTSEDVLDFAISREQKASSFYRELAGRMQNPAVRDVFLDFSLQETQHKAKLVAIKNGGGLMLSKQNVSDLKIGDNLADPELNEGMTYQEALVVAIKAEQTAIALYDSLAAATGDPGLRELFESLALEESKHKLHFETEYDDVILTEN